MKKVYEHPMVEKIAFRYRDQVVAASGDGGTSTDFPNNPSIGQLTSESWGQNGCKVYAFEAADLGFCNYA